MVTTSYTSFMTKMLPTALAFDKLYAGHETGYGHPENPSRNRAILKALQPFVKNGRILKSRQATWADLTTCHSEDYLKIARNEIESGRTRLSTGDTQVCEASWDIAMHAAGATLEAVDALAMGKARNAFCGIRPPGHHAEPDRGMGFCIVNNVAIAARYAQKKHHIQRVMIYDWDVHHGNGTQACFYEDDSVFYCSTHQWPLYPGTGSVDEKGKGQGEGFTLNGPFPAGTGYDVIRAFLEDDLIPAMKTFKPQLIIISAGFDSRIEDPLGRFTLTDAEFRLLTRMMMDMADHYAGGKLLSVLEGGYNIDGLASAIKAHVSELIS
jgi:acetoin utilization deacetylase AcuC-like enzyme